MNRTALPRSRRWTTTAVVGGSLAGAALLGGGVALADGGGSDAPSSTPAPPADGPAGVDDTLVGTVTAVSEDSLTLTDDAGDSHTVTLDDETRTGPGGPGAGGPGAGGPGAGGPGAGGPGAGGPGAGGPGADDPAADADAPAADADDSTPPADAPAPSGEVPSGEAPSGEVPAGDAPSGDTPTLPAPEADAGGSLSDIAVGDRVEVRVADGVATEVHEVRAHVDGVVVSVDGTDLTVVTTPGLRVDVDAAALSDLPAEGDTVHLQGTVSSDGQTVVAADGAR